MPVPAAHVVCCSLLASHEEKSAAPLDARPECHMNSLCYYYGLVWTSMDSSILRLSHNIQSMIGIGSLLAGPYEMNAYNEM